jgi:DNA-binding SARP family transcriptional activator/tetratricopeptide (TPR) repeat protein
MVRLKTFNGLSLDREGGQPHGTIRKRHLALLALLASNREQGMSRDKLTAYLWPESDTARARNNLKQTLFGLRQLLGSSSIQGRGGFLFLDAGMVHIDVWEFESALAGRDDAGAVALYRGPYLDGFYLERLPEFERWIETERGRLRELYVEALLRLAQAADTSKDSAAAVAWWGRLAQTEPLSTSIALGFMRALVAAGDRPAAIEHAAHHGAQLSAELGVPPDGAVVALADQLKRELNRTPPPTRGALTSRRATPGRRTSDVLVASAVLPAAIPRVTPARKILAAALAAALLVIVGAAFTRPVRSSRGLVDPAAVVVLPFSATGSAKALDLVGGLETLLATSLDGADGLRSVAEVVTARRGTDRTVALDDHKAAALAARAGARLYVTGYLIGQGEHLRATALLRDRGNANAVVGRAEAESENVFDLVDELAKQLITEQHGDAGGRLVRSAALSTRSVVALKAYLEGERLLRAGRPLAARDAFSLAVGADTGFALGYYRMSVAAHDVGERELALSAAEHASRLGALLSEREQGLVNAYEARLQGRFGDAERIYHRLLTQYPEDADAWFGLGELLFHGNPLRGLSVRGARASLERGLAYDSLNLRAWMYLSRLAGMHGDHARTDSLQGRLAAARRAAPFATIPSAFAILHRPGALYPADLTAVPAPATRAAVAPGAPIYLADLVRSEGVADRLARAGAGCETVAAGHRLLAELAVARGGLRAANAHLAEAEPCDYGAVLELRTFFAALPFIPMENTELTQLRAALRRARSDSMRSALEVHPSVVIYGLGLTALREGDTLTAIRHQRDLLQLRDSTPMSDLASSLAASLRARIALAQGRRARALAAIEGARWTRAADLSVIEVADRYLRATLLQELGREEEAIGWYRSIAERASYELVAMGPAEYQLGRIYERRRAPGEAARRYRQFIDLWAQPSPELRPLTRDAERRLKLLSDF